MHICLFISTTTINFKVRNIFMKLIFICLLLALAPYSHAQNMLRVTHLSVEDGLSQSSVYSIMQDSYGFIWMATGDGLNRYDGRDFIAYKSKLNNTLSGQLKDRNINSTVHEDKNHNLWFAADEGVYCLDRRSGRFTIKLNKFNSGYAATLAATHENEIWFYVPTKGLHCFFADDRPPQIYPAVEKLDNPHDPILVKNVIISPVGIWIIDDHGLLFYDKKTHKGSRVLTMSGINDGYLLRSGRLALSTMGGIYTYDIHTHAKQFIRLGNATQSNIAWDEIAEDTVQGNLYLGELHGGTMARLQLSTGLYHIFSIQKNTINCLFIDRSQNLWVGTEGAGLYRLDIKPDRFHCYKPENNNATLMVKSLFRNGADDIWFGTYANGLLRYNTTTQQTKRVPFVRFSGDSYCGVVMRDSTGDILASGNSTIMWIDSLTGRKKREITLYHYWGADDMKHVTYSILEWKKGHYLAATNQTIQTFTQAGSCKSLDNSNFIRDSLVNGWMYNFYKAHDGIIYVGKRNGYAGIRMINDSTATVVHHGLRGITVRHFYKSNNTPLLWLATEQGLVAWDSTNKKYTVFDEASSSIANSYVYAILPQNDSTLWISTNNGISRVSTQYHKNGKVDADFRNYSVKDGLQSNEFNTGAFYQCADGTMLFGGIAGFNWFRPQDVLPNPYKAIPAITGIYVNDSLITTDTAMYVHNLNLPYARNTISLTLRALEYTMPEQNVYAYMLEGVDKDWVQTTNDKVRYANLQPGGYRFLFKVRNNESLWNEEPLVLMIAISPPWWQTWWFRGLTALLLAGLGTLAARFYARRKVLAKTRELEQQHALNMERIRISKDVHDDIGSGLSKISLLSQIANSKIKDNQALSGDISNISSISKELVDNMRDLIWLLNPENTTLDSLAARIREYSADYLDGMSVGVFFEFPESVPTMSISRNVQRNILLTVKEAINNSVKHARAGIVRIKLTIDKDVLSISISDNGKGFNINSISGRGNGLRNMRHRIETLGGNCDIASETNEGTVIHMSIPFNKITVET